MGIELAYINTKHPDFTEAGLVHRALTDGLRENIHNMKIQEPNKQDDNRVSAMVVGHEHNQHCVRLQVMCCFRRAP